MRKEIVASLTILAVFVAFQLFQLVRDGLVAAGRTPPIPLYTGAMTAIVAFAIYTMIMVGVCTRTKKGDK